MIVRGLIILLLALLVRSTLAHPLQKVERVVATKDIHKITVETFGGILRFEALGHRYVYTDHVSPVDNNAGRLSAILAVLSELRRADRVTLYIDPAADDKEPDGVVGMIFHYESLREMTSSEARERTADRGALHF